MFIRDGGADSVVWSSSNTAIAQVDSATGKVTAIAPGTAVITAKAGSKSATCNVKVRIRTLNDGVRVIDMRKLFKIESPAKPLTKRIFGIL